MKSALTLPLSKVISQRSVGNKSNESDHKSTNSRRPVSGRGKKEAQVLSAREKEQRMKDAFFKGCVESLLMDRKDRTTVGGHNKLNETLNKLLLNNTELAKWLLLKRVNEIT